MVSVDEIIIPALPHTCQNPNLSLLIFNCNFTWIRQWNMALHPNQAARLLEQKKFYNPLVKLSYRSGIQIPVCDKGLFGKQHISQQHMINNPKS